MNAKAETVSIGPIRIPKTHKAALAKYLEGKDHLTYSDLIRDAIYIYLKQKKLSKMSDFESLSPTPLDEELQKFLDLAVKAIALSFAIPIAAFYHPPFSEGIKRIQENARLLVQLSQLSALPIEEVIEKIQGHPCQIDTILDFYRIHGRFPND